MPNMTKPKVIGIPHDAPINTHRIHDLFRRAGDMGTEYPYPRNYRDSFEAQRCLAETIGDNIRQCLHREFPNFSYLSPGHIPHIEGMRNDGPTPLYNYDISQSVDIHLRYLREVRFDVFARMVQCFRASMVNRLRRHLVNPKQEYLIREDFKCFHDPSVYRIHHAGWYGWMEIYTTKSPDSVAAAKAVEEVRAISA